MYVLNENMFKSKLEVFILKRVLVSYIILAVLDIIFLRQRWIAAAGLTAGGIIGLARFGSAASLFRKVLSTNSTDAAVGTVILKYITGQAPLIIVLAVSLIFDLWFFMGAAAGILLVPLSIAINGITEALGLTRNGFE